MRPLGAAALAVLAALAACGEPRRGDSPPTAAFVARSVVPTGWTVAFDASWSRDNGLLVSYAFDFGDDSPVQVSLSPLAGHAYVAAGTYLVTLTVQDDLGNRGTDTHQVVVTDAYAPCTQSTDCAADSACTEGECRIRPPG